MRTPQRKLLKAARHTCLVYLPRLLTSNSVKPLSSLTSVAVIGLLCRFRVNSAVHSKKIADGIVVSLQQQVTSTWTWLHEYSKVSSIVPCPCVRWPNMFDHMTQEVLAHLLSAESTL